MQFKDVSTPHACPCEASSESGDSSLIYNMAANTELADIDITLLPNPTVRGVNLTTGNDELQWWKLRLVADGEVDVANAIVISAGDPTRGWFRVT